MQKKNMRQKKAKNKLNIPHNMKANSKHFNLLRQNLITEPVL